MHLDERVQTLLRSQTYVVPSPRPGVRYTYPSNFSPSEFESFEEWNPDPEIAVRLIIFLIFLFIDWTLTTAGHSEAAVWTY